MNRIDDKSRIRKHEIRIGRAIRALLQQGMSPNQVAELLELNVSDLQLWINLADEKL